MSDDDGMRALKLCDFLDFSAQAVDETEPAMAETAWLEASLAASGLFPAGSLADCEAGLILAASRPDRIPDRRAALWNALNAAFLYALAATGAQRELASVIWPDALAATDQLGHAEQIAVLALLAEARDMAGVTA